MELRDFCFDLPNELIAQESIKERQMSRIMVLEKSGQALQRILKSIVYFADIQ